MNRMYLKLTCLFAFCIATVFGQSKYCCYPVTWESVNFANRGQVQPGTKKAVYTEITEKLSVDGVNHRIASFSTVNIGGYKIQVQILQLYSKSTMYVVESGACKTYKIPPWAPLCVPDDATLAKKTYYGLGNNKVDLDIYAAAFASNTLYLTIAREGCVPVYQSTYGTSEAGSSLGFKTFSNITLGIKDMSVFDIPSSCVNITGPPVIMAKQHGLY